MRLLKMFPSSINERYIDLLANALRDGAIAICPTDTFYALVCNALDNRAIEKICRLKGIDPKKRSLAIMCQDISQAAEYTRIDNNAFSLMKRNLPGPFTFILPSSTRLPKVFKGRKEVGVRIPDNPIDIALVSGLGNPLMTTSVEWDGAGDDITLPEAIFDHYEPLGVDFMIDTGEGHNTGSTIVDLTDSTEPLIVRQGLGVIS